MDPGGTAGLGGMVALGGMGATAATDAELMRGPLGIARQAQQPFGDDVQLHL
ncbi:hypothetical protein LRC484719_15660 [Mycobacterium riyadhense]